MQHSTARTRSTLFDIVYADQQRIIHLVLIDKKLNEKEAVLQRHDEREREFPYVHVALEPFHEDPLLVDAKINRAFLLEKIVVFQRGTRIGFLLLRCTSIHGRALRTSGIHSFVLSREHTPAAYFNIVFVVNLQSTRENVTHDQDVVLLVVHSQSVHGIVMRKKRIALGFHDVLEENERRSNIVRVHEPCVNTLVIFVF